MVIKKDILKKYTSCTNEVHCARSWKKALNINLKNNNNVGTIFNVNETVVLSNMNHAFATTTTTHYFFLNRHRVRLNSLRTPSTSACSREAQRKTYLSCVKVGWHLTCRNDCVSALWRLHRQKRKVWCVQSVSPCARRSLHLHLRRLDQSERGGVATRGVVSDLLGKTGC